MSTIAQLAWARWKIIGEAFGDFQARLFAVLFYFTILVPFALAARFFSDPLRIKKRNTSWVEREAVGHSLEDARRQF